MMTTPGNNRLFLLLFPGLLIAWVFGLYSCIMNAPFVFDDTDSLVKIGALLDRGGIKAIWHAYSHTRFIGLLTFVFNHGADGNVPFGYHLVNIVIHAGTSLCVWWLALLITASPPLQPNVTPRERLVLAALSAALFASHPVQTQAVTYIIQRYASLGACFYLLSLCFYASCRIPDAPHRSAKYAASFIMALLALFTKENTVTLPLAVILYEYFFAARNESKERFLPLPFLLLTAIIPLSLSLQFHGGSHQLDEILRETGKISRSSYLLTECRVILTYLRLLVFPVNQNLDYDYPLATGVGEPGVLGGIFISIILLLSAVFLFRRNRLLSFSLLFFFLALLPESGIIPISDVIFEHRLYLPLLGWALFLPAAVHGLPHKNLTRTLLILIGVLLVFSGATIRRNLLWRSPLALWNDTVLKSPAKPRPYLNRGMAFVQQGRWAEAKKDFETALSLKPGYVLAYNNLGLIALKERDYSQALLQFDEAIKRYPSLPDLYNNRGNANAAMGQTERAREDFSKAIGLKPGYAEAYNNRGRLFLGTGKTTEAIADFSAGIAADPGLTDLYENRGIAYQRAGTPAAALSDFNRALSLDPRSMRALFGRAVLFCLSGSYERAIQDWSRIIELDPDNTDALYNRAVAFSLLDNPGAAVEDIRTLERLGIPPDAKLRMILSGTKTP